LRHAGLFVGWWGHFLRAWSGGDGWWGGLGWSAGKGEKREEREKWRGREKKTTEIAKVE